MQFPHCRVVPMLWYCRPKFLHRLIKAVQDLHICFGPFPQNLRVALYKMSIDQVKINKAVLVDIAFPVVNLCPHANSMFQFPQPVTCLSLFDIRLGRHVMAEYYSGEKHRMADLESTGFEMLNTFFDIGTRSAFAKAGCYSILDVVR